MNNVFLCHTWAKTVACECSLVLDNSRLWDGANGCSCGWVVVGGMGSGFDGDDGDGMGTYNGESLCGVAHNDDGHDGGMLVVVVIRGG